jgi:hypothetical protein
MAMKLSGFVRVLALLLFFCRCAYATPFQATPLIDFGADQKYLGAFSGLLYDGSNTLLAGSQHDLDGRAFASKVQPLNAQGQPDPNGKIAVVGIGMSSWTMELCVRVSKTDTTLPACTATSFIPHADAVDNPKVRIVDCASGGQTANMWFDDSFGNWTRCNGLLANEGLTPAQVQVILWENINALYPTVSLSPTTNCSVLTTFDNSTPDVCKYIRRTGQVARFAKTWYPHVQQVFLHSKIYAGYATKTFSPEPYAYENGFGVKWVIQAQINQIASGKITNLAAGNLAYAVAPWLVWGPYFWASGTTPRSDGLTWQLSDFLTSDYTHPSQSGVQKVTDMMMNWYFASPYTSWIK